MKFVMKYVRYWLLLSLAAAGMWGLIWLSTAQPASSSTAEPTFCESVRSSSDAIAGRMPSAPTWSEQNTNQYRQDWLAVHNLIIDHAECFPLEMVAQARAQMQTYFGH